MNAPLRVAKTASLGDIEDFAECCKIQAWFCDNGWSSLQTAVDHLQWLAERWGLIDEFGQDFVQSLIAYDTMEPAKLSDYEANYIQRVVAQWEAADAARPRSVAKAPDRYRPASSTIDAFFTVARSQPAEYLAGWLAGHPQDAPHLHKLWIEKCSQTTK
jgi:hypothetical protein